jgi:hypothetical protein
MDIVVEGHGCAHEDVDGERGNDVSLLGYDVSAMVSLSTNRCDELGAID